MKWFLFTVFWMTPAHEEVNMMFAAEYATQEECEAVRQTLEVTYGDFDPLVEWYCIEDK